MGRHRQDDSQNFWIKNRDNIPTGLRLTYNQGVYESVTHESARMKVSSIRVSHMEVSHIKVPHMKVKVSHMEVPLVDIIKKIKILDGNARLNTFLHILFWVFHFTNIRIPVTYSSFLKGTFSYFKTFAWLMSYIANIKRLEKNGFVLKDPLKASDFTKQKNSFCW